MYKMLTDVLSHGATDAFYLSDDVQASYGDLARAVDAASAQLQAAGVGRGGAVIIVGDFSLTSIAGLIALILNGNIVVPHTRVSLSKLRAEVDLLQPTFEIDACGGDLKITPCIQTGASPLAGVLPDDTPGLVVFTSGTSGRPKAIVHNLFWLLEKFAKRKSKKIRAIPFLLFDHMGGFNTLISILLGQGSIVFSAERDVDAICARVARFKVDVLPTTPTFLGMMLLSQAWTRYDLSSLKTVTYGTEVMSEALLTRLVEVLPGVRFKQTYGLSEIGVLMTSSEANDTTWVRLLGDGLETRIEDGILWIKVESVMLGRVIYDERGATFEPHDDSWFCTGDMVDVKGDMFRFKGRASEIINVAGLKVYPSEIENCLMQLREVSSAVVFGKKNPLVGAIVKAKIELADPTSDPGEMGNLILDHCKAHLDRFKVPKEIEFVDGVEVTDRLKTRRI